MPLHLSNLGSSVIFLFVAIFALLYMPFGGKNNYALINSSFSFNFHFWSRALKVLIIVQRGAKTTRIGNNPTLVTTLHPSWLFWADSSPLGMQSCYSGWIIPITRILAPPLYYIIPKPILVYPWNHKGPTHICRDRHAKWYDNHEVIIEALLGQIITIDLPLISYKSIILVQ